VELLAWLLKSGERHRNGETSKINIVLGEPLLPNYTHLLPKGEKRRLIPIPILPPMIGSKNTYAAQAFLQLLLLEEFSDQSRAFAEKGFICLPWEKWVTLGSEAKLPQSVLFKVLEGWIVKRDEVQENGYILGAGYFQLSDFLRAQGNLREKRSKMAVGQMKKNLRKVS
jgi:hypothetical protein